MRAGVEVSPTSPFPDRAGKVSLGALTTVPAVATERPLWVSKSAPLPLIIGPRSVLGQALREVKAVIQMWPVAYNFA